MKTKNLFRVLPAVAAMLLLAACSSDEQNVAPAAEPEAPVSEGTVIHYSATVSDGTSTRATLNGSKEYEFQTGDKLRITGTDISGDLTLTSGAGTANATFEGDLTFIGAGSPADDLALNAVLVSTSNAMTTLTYDAATYPTTAIASTLAEAVERYSYFKATSTYSAKNFSLSQQTSFLNFTVTLTDGTTADTNLAIDIKNGGSSVRTGNVTTADDSGVKAKFVAAMPAGTTMSSASFQLGSKSAVSFGGTTTLAANKIYNISKTIAHPFADVTSSDIGKLICTSGHIHAYNADAACTASRVAIIAYVGSDGSVDASSSTYKGLAIALTDANSGNTCQWFVADNGKCVSQTSTLYTAITYKNGIASTNTLTSDSHTHAAATAAKNFGTVLPSGVSGWFLPSMGQWNLIVQGLATKKSGSTVSTNLTTSTNNTYKASNLNSVITAAGGTGFQSDAYWSSTECNNSNAWTMDFSSGRAINYNKSNVYYGHVRAVFAF